jgi:large subunit ribosomal protein L20
MVRVKRGSVGRVKHKKILGFAAGFKGGHSRLFRTANQQVMKARLYSYVGRKRRKRDFKMLWACRVNAGLKVGVGTNRQFFQLKTIMGKRPYSRGLAGGRFYQIRHLSGLGLTTDIDPEWFSQLLTHHGFQRYITYAMPRGMLDLKSWYKHILKGMGAKLDVGGLTYGPPWPDHIMERFASKLSCGSVVKKELTEQVCYVCGFSYGPTSRWRFFIDSISISGFLAGPFLEDIDTAYAQGYAWFNRFLTNNRIILNRKMLAQLVLTGELTNLVTTSLLMGLVLECRPMYGISQRYHPYQLYPRLGLGSN